jgi:AcrR family transcriptional regulator
MTGSGLADLHRARILASIARTLDERGYASTTVALVIESARVSRARFYELFSGTDACVATLLEELVGFVEHHLRERRLAVLPWDERVRQGLWVILSCLEQEPLLARVCVLHSVAVDSSTAERRERVIAALVDQVDAGRELSGSEHTTPMTAEGVVGAAMRLVYSRLAAGDPSPVLTDLFAELTNLILLPYLNSEQIREIQRRPTPAAVTAEGNHPLGGALDTSAEEADPLKGIAIRVTQRTALALKAVSDYPGESNRAVANRAGITDPGQASKLLARLERLGLITNGAVRGTKWELNSWTLTPAGDKVVQLLGTRVSFAPSDMPAMASLASAEGA